MRAITVSCGMLTAVITLLFCLLSLTAKQVQAQFQAAPQEWELNAEGGLDFRGFSPVEGSLVSPENPVSLWYQGTLNPVAAISYYRRITNLRAYYGLRGEGHYAAWDDQVSTGSAYTAAALIAYKAFIFDMEGDCDCPRWDKSNFLQKAFFVEFGAGYGRQAINFDSGDEGVARGGAAYLARFGFAVRLKKQIDVYLAGGGHGIIAKEWADTRHEIAIRPALGITWRPYYNRF